MHVTLFSFLNDFYDLVQEPYILSSSLALSVGEG